MRSRMGQFRAQEIDGQKYIVGYFAVFNSVYQITPKISESIDPGAFDGQTEEDIRALINHDDTLVLGRTKAGTLELKITEKGLWGKILINENDQDALNLYARVQRGDVDQCSFGFEILEEKEQIREDGGTHWLIKKVQLFEVSCCTFPAYEDTSIEARKRQTQIQTRARETEAWKKRLKERIQSGIKTAIAG